VLRLRHYLLRLILPFNELLTNLGQVLNLRKKLLNRKILEFAGKVVDREIAGPFVKLGFPFVPP
jgi:hypothetical protein